MSILEDKISTKYFRFTAISGGVALVVLVMTITMGLVLPAPEAETNTINNANPSLLSETKTAGAKPATTVNHSIPKQDAIDTVEVTSNGTIQAAEGVAEYNEGIDDHETNTNNTSASSPNTSSANREPVWIPGWEETVWVASETPIYIGENPIYGIAYYCNGCGADVTDLFVNGWPMGFCPGSPLVPNDMHVGWNNFGPWRIIGYEPLYEYGYWSTIQHEGYWQY